MQRIIPIVGLLVLGAGCGQRVLSYPTAHVPVLISRVDRIGARAPTAASELAVSNTTDSVLVTGSRSSDAQTMDTTAWVERSHGALTRSVQGRHDREVRLQSVRAKATTMILTAFAIHDERISGSGVLVEVKP